MLMPAQLKTLRLIFMLLMEISWNIMFIARKYQEGLFFNNKNKRIPQRYTLVCLHIYFDTRVVFYLHFLSLIAKCYYCYYCYYYGNLILIAKTLLSQNSKMNRCYFVSTTFWLTELIKQLKNAKATFWRFISMYKVYASY